MTSALAALVVLGQAGVVSAPVPTADEPIHVQADKQESDSDAQHITLTGHAQLRTSGTLVHGDSITLDQDTNLLTATGSAFCVSGFLGAVADQLTLDLSTGTVGMQQGHFFEKKKVTLERMLAAQSPAELQSLGQTALAGTADRIQRGGGGHLYMKNLTFTPCDCEPRDPLRPHWSIQSLSADVVLGEGAWLWLPVIRVYGAPVLALPVMYVPLSDRKTGLLPILPNYSALNGWSIPIPVYVTRGAARTSSRTSATPLVAPRRWPASKGRHSTPPFASPPAWTRTGRRSSSCKTTPGNPETRRTERCGTLGQAPSTGARAGSSPARL
jgi:LPS-assembly protein